AMFRNYLAAALQNLVRNKFFATVNILGLAIGFAAAILIGLYVRHEYAYDRWIPGHEQTFAVHLLVSGLGANPTRWNTTTSDLGDLLNLEFPEIEAVGRLRVDTPSLRRGMVEANETIYWADPNFFRVVSLPAIAGDVVDALAQPDGIVLTRRMARKY